MTTRGIFERPARSGVWWISYCDAEGKRHREKIGRRSAALDAVVKRRLEIAEGRFIPPRAGARLLFRDLAHSALQNKKLRLAPLSYRTDVDRLKQLLPLIGNVPADRLTPARIEETLAVLKARVSSSTVNRYRSLIGSIYSFALRAGKIATNPVSRVKRFKENESRLRFLSPEEEKAIREAFVADVHEWEFDLALQTGMRRGEQFGLLWKDVNWEAKTLTVRGKTGRRHIKANTSAIAALRKLHAVTGGTKFVCPDRDENHTRDWRRWFEEAVKKAKVDDFHWHDLRHTFASRLVMRGVDIRTVQTLLGHKNVQMTMRYAHLSADHSAQAVEKMNEEPE